MCGAGWKQDQPTKEISMTDTARKTWFITGASNGFGREWTEAALERGDRVAATATRFAPRSTAAAGCSEIRPRHDRPSSRSSTPPTHPRVSYSAAPSKGWKATTPSDCAPGANGRRRHWTHSVAQTCPLPPRCDRSPGQFRSPLAYGRPASKPPLAHLDHPPTRGPGTTGPFMGRTEQQSNLEYGSRRHQSPRHEAVHPDH